MERAYFLMQTDNLYGFINKDGKFVIRPTYKMARDYSDGLAAVKTIDGIKGFIDYDNKLELTMNYDYVSDFSNGFASFRYEGKEGLINKNGEVVIEPKYDRVGNIDIHGYLLVEVEGKRYTVDKTGNFANKGGFNSFSHFHDGLALAVKDGKTGFINEKFELVIDCKYENCWSFSEGLALISSNDEKHGYINTKGEVVIEPQFYQSFDFKCGLARFRDSKSKYGFIDKTGKVVIKNKYQYVGDFSEGLAVIQVKDRQGYIDVNGKIIVNPVFSSAHEFKNGLGLVTYGPEWGYINTKGEWVYKPKGFDL